MGRWFELIRFLERVVLAPARFQLHSVSIRPLVRYSSKFPELQQLPNSLS